VEAIAVTPQKRKVEVINQAEPKILTPTDVKLRMLEAGVCGTDKEICAFEYGTPPSGSEQLVIDSKWEVIDPTTLDKRRSAGRLALNWYRIKITVPERVGNFDPAGSTLVFATSTDDYAEIWVDGELPRAAGQSGGSVIKSWNAENRLVVGRDVKPGQKIQLAIFGINGPISDPPTNYIYMRYAKLELHKVQAAPCRSYAARSECGSGATRSGNRCDRSAQSEDL
jgi:hypothetical protein